MREIILFHVSGDDRPGITSAITRALADYGVDILDVGQAVIHRTLLLGILAELPRGRDSSPLVKEVLFTAHSLGLDVRFEPVTEDSYADWQGDSGRNRQIITLLTRRVTGQQMARISAIVHEQGLNIENITRLSGRVPLDDGPARSKACVELRVRGTPRDASAMRAAFLSVASELDLDVAFQADSVFRRHRRLVAFDMDSTLIEAEVIDELAAEAGVGPEVAAITERAMRGEIDFRTSFEQRVALLRGLEERVLADVAERLPITEGAERLVRTLRSVGFRTAILSGGFTYFGERLKAQLGIDYLYANELEIVDGRVTGRVVGAVVDGPRKAELLAAIAEREGIRLEQVIAVGDGANDLPMLSLAGLGIAFRAKPIVRETAGQAISTLGLDGILYLLGFHDMDIEG